MPAIHHKTVEDCHKVTVFIGDIVSVPNYRQEGKNHELLAICKEEDKQSDSVLPAFQLEFRLTRVARAMHHGKVDYELHEIESKYHERAPASYTVRCQTDLKTKFVLESTCLQHIYRNHSVSEGAYKTARMSSPFARKGKYNSAFLERDSILPLILSTLRNSDAIRKQESNRKAVERLFDTEIGHNWKGCCWIVRVVIRRISRSHHWNVVTAFPVSEYHVDNLE